MSSGESATPSPPKQIKFHQIKGNFFRAIHADGAYISVHPNQFVHMTFFSERVPLAQEIVYNLTDEGQLLDEDRTKQVSKGGFVREMEVDVILNRGAAEGLHKWLTDYLADKLPKGKIKAL